MEMGFRKLRSLVSKKKRRFQEGSFDLDLTYVTDRVIAMGAPCQGIEAAFRNPLSEVKIFFDTRHTGHYKVFNLCSEREAHCAAHFPAYEHVPFDDHNPCPLEILAELCGSIDAYLAQDPLNVVAVHCKAGKGRTGLVVAAYLQHARICGSAEEALELFALKRTYNGKGVTIPSQIRYAHYYGDLLRESHNESAPAFLLKGVRLVTVPSTGFKFGGGIYFKLRVWREKHRKMVSVYNYTSASEELQSYRVAEDIVDMDCSACQVKTHGDVHLTICAAPPLPGGKHKELCGLWFNTRFCGQEGELRFPKAAVDGASKDKKHKRFANSFEVRVRLEPLGDDGAHVSVKSTTTTASDCEAWWDQDDCDSDESPTGLEQETH